MSKLSPPRVDADSTASLAAAVDDPKFMSPVARQLPSIQGRRPNPPKGVDPMGGRIDMLRVGAHAVPNAASVIEFRPLRDGANHYPVDNPMCAKLLPPPITVVVGDESITGVVGHSGPEPMAIGSLLDLGPNLHFDRLSRGSRHVNLYTTDGNGARS